MFSDSSSATSPKTTCLPSSQLVTTVVTKNCEPLLRGDGLAVVMSPGKMLCRGRSVCLRVWAGVGHGQKSGLGVLSGEVLVGELLAVDGLATGALG